MIMSNFLRVGPLISNTMATTSDVDAHGAPDESDARSGDNVGMNHPTVVPENFDLETTDCPRCGRPLADHE